MNIVLTGGGTGGHIMPNLALVEELNKHFDKIYYVGSTNLNEQKLVENYSVEYIAIDAPKLIRKFTLKNLLIPFKLVKCISKCRQILNDIKADIVFSKGGFISLPVVLAAKKLNKKIIIHESDISLGLANKICSKYASKVCCSFNLKSSSEKIIYTGPAIRKEFLNPKPKKIFNNNKKTILVVGGSQGSNYINSFIYDNIDKLTKDFNIIHICGHKKSKATSNESYLPIEFSNEMATLIKSSDIVLTRGGSNTLFEILNVDKPMIILPLSSQTRGEQIENAKFFTQNNLAITIEKLNINDFKNIILNQLENSKNINPLVNKSIKKYGNKEIVNIILNECKKI